MQSGMSHRFLMWTRSVGVAPRIVRVWIASGSDGSQRSSRLVSPRMARREPECKLGIQWIDGERQLFDPAVGETFEADDVHERAGVGFEAGLEGSGDGDGGGGCWCGGGG